MGIELTKEGPCAWRWSIGQSKKDNVIIQIPSVLRDEKSLQLAQLAVKCLQESPVAADVLNRGYRVFEVQPRGSRDARLTVLDDGSCWAKILDSVSWIYRF